MVLFGSKIPSRGCPPGDDGELGGILGRCLICRISPCQNGGKYDGAAKTSGHVGEHATIDYII